MSSKEVEVEGHVLKLTHLDKVLFPEDGITKGDLVDYYVDISRTMLPHVEGRPLNMQRFPNGIDSKGFMQQSIADYFPEWVDRVTVERKEGGSVTHVVCNNAATLAYLANLACVTPHLWLSRADNLNYPDKMILDLDPMEGFEQARSGAMELRGLLQDLGLEPFVMTTGSRGLHVAVPLDRKKDFEYVRSFARDVAEALVRRCPDLATTAQRKEERQDKLFVDTIRNSYGQTSVAPYAVRARPGAPIAAPMEWEELKDKEIDAQYYKMDNIFEGLKRRPDPWRDFFRRAVSLEAPERRLRDMLSSETD